MQFLRGNAQLFKLKLYETWVSYRRHKEEQILSKSLTLAYFESQGRL